MILSFSENQWRIEKAVVKVNERKKFKGNHGISYEGIILIDKVIGTKKSKLTALRNVVQVGVRSWFYSGKNPWSKWWKNNWIDVKVGFQLLSL